MFTFQAIGKSVTVIFKDGTLFGVVRHDHNGNVILCDPPITEMVSSNDVEDVFVLDNLKNRLARNG